MPKLKEWAFDCEKEDGCDDVNAEFDAEKSRRRSEIDVVICAELFDPVNDKFLNQIGAVGNAGDERGARNRNSKERQPRTDRANEKRSHAHGDERELPHTGRDGEGVCFAEIQCVNDYPERG